MCLSVTYVGGIIGVMSKVPEEHLCKKTCSPKLNLKKKVAVMETVARFVTYILHSLCSPETVSFNPLIFLHIFTFLSSVDSTRTLKS